MWLCAWDTQDPQEVSVAEGEQLRDEKRRDDNVDVNSTLSVGGRSWQVPWGFWASFRVRWESVEEPQEGQGEGEADTIAAPSVTTTRP